MFSGRIFIDGNIVLNFLVEEGICTEDAECNLSAPKPPPPPVSINLQINEDKSSLWFNGSQSDTKLSNMVLCNELSGLDVLMGVGRRGGRMVSNIFVTYLRGSKILTRPERVRGGGEGVLKILVSQIKM